MTLQNFDTAGRGPQAEDIARTTWYAFHMRTVVVTGATSGFGKSLVRHFLDNGDRVIATGRRLTARKDVLESERGKWPARLIEHDLDVTSSEDRSRFEEFCRVKLDGRVDILVNNAGYGLFGAFEDLSETEMRAQFEVNFFGLALLMRDLLPFLRVSKGKIFNLSSAFGVIGFPLTSLYCASKHAVEGLSESLRTELQPHGVQICLIEPGSYQTGFKSGSAWPQRTPLDSPFARQTLLYKEFRSKLAAARPTNPDLDEVPRGLVKLSNKSRLPLRAAFGKDARSSILAKKILPAGLFNMIFDFYLGRTINR